MLAVARKRWPTAPWTAPTWSTPTSTGSSTSLSVVQIHRLRPDAPYAVTNRGQAVSPRGGRGCRRHRAVVFARGVGGGSAVWVDEPELKIARLSVHEAEYQLSRMDFHYLAATREGIERLTERHALGLFTRKSTWRRSTLQSWMSRTTARD